MIESNAATLPPSQAFRPGVDELGEGEQLDYQPEAYKMYHSMRPEWPCLSIDIMPDMMGASRTSFPMTVYMVAGTQADRADKNQLQLLKVSDLHKTQQDDDDVALQGDEMDDDPIIDAQRIPYRGGINRVRVMPQAPHVVASMADTRMVHLMDVRPRLAALDASNPEAPGVLGSARAAAVARGTKSADVPVASFAGHTKEGFALDWSRKVRGRLATGDCAGHIRVWDAVAGKAAGAAATGRGDLQTRVAVDGAVWRTSPKPYTGHTASVEELQWSPREAAVFASCGCDQQIRIWDARDLKGCKMAVKAATSDINVMSWNTRVNFLLASGNDDGSFKVWDLRMWRKGPSHAKPVASYTWHRGAVTSIQWDPHDPNCLVAASEDDTVSLWDFSLEADDDVAKPSAAASSGSGAAAGGDSRDFPAQLLFLHSGQSSIKEATFHPQIPGLVISTAGDSFNFFKPDVQL